MGCRCNERGAAISHGLRAAARGDIRTAVGRAAFVARTLVADLRQQGARREMALRLTRRSVLR